MKKTNKLSPLEEAKQQFTDYIKKGDYPFEIEQDEEGQLLRNANNTNVFFEVKHKETGKELFLKIPYRDPKINQIHVFRSYYIKKTLGNQRPHLERLFGEDPVEFKSGWRGILSERADHDLKEYTRTLESNKKNSREFIDILLQLADGLKDLHYGGFILRDGKTSNALQYSDGTWAWSDLATHGVINEDVVKKQTYSQLYDTKSHGHTIGYLCPTQQGIVGKRPELSTYTDLYVLLAMYLEYEHGKNPAQLFEEQYPEGGFITLDFVKDLLFSSPNLNDFEKQTLWRLGAPIIPEIIPSGTKFESYRYTDISQFIKQAKEKEIVVPDSDARFHEDYQQFLRQAKNLETIINKANNSKKTGIFNTLNIKEVEKFQEAYQAYMNTYNSEVVKQVSGRVEIDAKVQPKAKQLIETELRTLDKEFEQPSGKIYSIPKTKFGKALWEVYAKAMMLGSNGGKGMYAYKDLQNPKEEYTKRMKQKIENQ